MSTGITDKTPGQLEPIEPRIVAVIDIGATSVRMMIAEVHTDGSSRTLESLAQAVQLGRDSFINGEITRATIEDCVHVLKVYRAKLLEYGIDRDNDVRVVATSAVREADNRLAFQDRIYIATGFDIEPFDEAQLHRTTFLGIRPILQEHPELHDGHTVVCEVGGGTTELLVMEQGEVTFAQTYRLGSLRLIKTLEAFQAPIARSRELMESQIEKTAQQILAAIEPFEQIHFVVMGGELRLAAARIAGESQLDPLVTITIDQLDRFARSALQLTPDAIVNKYQLSINEAESLAPALLANLLIAKSLGVERLHVASVNLRDGLIKEMMTEGRGIGQAEQQVIDSAVALGRRFGFDEPHALHVDRLAVALFEQTRDLHLLGRQWKTRLRIAAVLHEVGKAINERSYHKHSLYIIRNSVFFGVSSRDIEMVALIARYHRRALPQPRHEAYSQLSRDDRVSVSKLAAILRMAKSLDASRSQRVQDIQCRVTGSTLRIFVPGITDVSLEQLDLRSERTLFEYIFGLKAELTLIPIENQPRDYSHE